MISWYLLFHVSRRPLSLPVCVCLRFSYHFEGHMVCSISLGSICSYWATYLLEEEPDSFPVSLWHTQNPHAFPAATHTNSPRVPMPAMCICSFAWINSHKCIMRDVFDYPEGSAQKQTYRVTPQCWWLGLHFGERLHLWPLKCCVGWRGDTDDDYENRLN